MHITVLTVGRLKESFWTQAVDEYLKRLQRYAKVDIVEVADRDSSRDEEVARAAEGADLLAKIGERDHVILLEIEGMQRSSEQLAARIEKLGVEGTSSLTFVIGGSVGVARPVRDRANERLSLGAITLPHNLARVVLIEQIYRAFKIIRHEPYHK